MRYFFILLSLLAFTAFAEDEQPANLEDVPDVVPQPPLPTKNGEILEPEPEIIIKRSEKKIIQEYRRSGRLYMIKVIPDIGPPYYFIDTNGDGKMDVQGSDLDRGGTVNMWKLLEW